MLKMLKMLKNQDEAGDRGIAADLAGTAGPRREHAGIAVSVCTGRDLAGTDGSAREHAGTAGKCRISDEQRENCEKQEQAGTCGNTHEHAGGSGEIRNLHPPPQNYGSLTGIWEGFVVFVGRT